MTRAEKIWIEYNQSMGEQNEKWKDLLADDITFTGPAAMAKGISEYIELTENFFQMVRGYEMKRYVANDNLVATEIEIKVATPNGNTINLDMTEFYEINDNKIQSVKVHYDAQEFRKEFGIN